MLRLHPNLPWTSFLSGRVSGFCSPDSNREERLKKAVEVLKSLDASLAADDPYRPIVALLLRASAQRTLLVDVYKSAGKTGVRLMDKSIVPNKSKVKMTESELIQGLDSDTCRCSPTLVGHCNGVSRRAVEFAAALLPSEFVPVFNTSGLWHDTGKSDRRNQAYFHGVTAYSASMPLLAKSLQKYSMEHDLKLRKQTGFLLGLRHECLSVKLFMEARKQGHIN
jgi:hypothetical protein